jgi:hypothetical protein
VGEPKGFLVVPIGFNPSDDLRSLELDAADNLKVVMGDTSLSALLTELQQKLETADLELITQVLSSGPHGWISGAWQKNPLLFGYSGFKGQYKENLNLAAGVNTIFSDIVPAGEIWVFSAMSFQYTGIVPTAVNIQISDGATFHIVYSVLAPVSTALYATQGVYVVPVGGRIAWQALGATLNDDLKCWAVGYRVDIDQ